MKFKSIQINSYKSFSESEEIQLSEGFNVIVGSNNVGKTALAEALSLRIQNRPHRSLETNNPGDNNSNVNITIGIDSSELKSITNNKIRILVPVPPKTNKTDINGKLEAFKSSLKDEILIKCKLLEQKFTSTYLHPYFKTHHSTPNSMYGMDVYIDKGTGDYVLRKQAFVSIDNTNNFTTQISNTLKNEIYFFNAERLNVSESQIATTPTLKPNASNLAQVLHLLQSKNLNRFQRFNDFVSKIFPDIKQITIPPISGNMAGILIWTVPPDTERDDLAVSLAESGTGIGQVLAILYVVLMAEHPKTIIIDEPQSFLHPGAIRKLFDILKQHKQHQYIVTTHSPTVVNSANAKTILLVSKKGGESQVENIDVDIINDQHLFLSAIGARLSDVFGADSILWVEGKTEELCFPLILSGLSRDQKALFGTSILGVIHTGDFEGKHSKTIFEIYSRLSKGAGLLPPAIGFVFDSEERTDENKKDLVRQSNGQIHFLPRRMFENYLLHPPAIASILTTLEVTKSPVTATDVQNWLEKNKFITKYYGEKGIDEINWLEKTHGAKILDDIFSYFSEDTHVYHKIEHGVELTKWLIKNTPERLNDIYTLIVEILETNEIE